jgi:hypothetical protein
MGCRRHGLQDLIRSHDARQRTVEIRRGVTDDSHPYSRDPPGPVSSGPIQAELFSGRGPLFGASLVELTTVLIAHRHPFSSSISLDGNTLDDALDDALDASLAAFTADIEAAVPSYVGIQLTIRQNGHPVTLTRIAPHRTATTRCGYRSRSSGQDSTLTAGSLSTPPPPARSSISPPTQPRPPRTHFD